MSHDAPHRHRRSRARLAASLLVAGVTLAGLGAVSAPLAGAQAPDAVLLGTADNFGVLAGAGVTNTGPTTVTGDLGTSPNPAVTGAGLTVLDGTIHAADAVAAQAQADLVVAYDDAAGRPAGEVPTELGGQLLTPGTYDSASGTFEITGALTLDAQGDPDAVFVFQAASTLVTASGSSVSIINGGSACNVFWQVGSSATLGTSSTLRGTVMALASITVTTGATLDGRALARTGSVTLDNDTITRSSCTTPTSTATTLAVAGGDDGTTTLTATVVADGGASPTGDVTFLDGDEPIGTGELQGGIATWTGPLPEGEYAITAVYLGAPGASSSTSSTVTHVVAAPAQVPTTTTSTPTPTSAPAASTSTPATTGADRERGAGGGGGTGTTTPARTTRGRLPATGSDDTGLLLAAIALVGAGFGVVRFAGRRGTRG